MPEHPSLSVQAPPPDGAALRLARLPPLTALRAFVVAARHLSFARAADELHVTAAAVGHQIRQLEAHLECVLFNRESRTLSLTEVGALLLPGLTEAFDGMARTLARLDGLGRSAPLVVATTPSFAVKWLVPRLDRLRERHPDLTVRIAASVDPAGIQEADCAILFGSGDYSGLHVERLLDESVFPVCSPALLQGAFPLDRPERLTHHTLLHDSSNGAEAGYPDWRMWLRAAGVIVANPDHGPQFDQPFVALEAAIAGQGVALAKASLVEADLRSGRLVRPFGDAQRVTFAHHFVCAWPKLDLPRVQRFRAWLQDEAAPPDYSI